MDKRILLLSGLVGSGKTTRLLHWCSGRKEIGGIVSPVVNEHRVFKDLRSGTIKNMEATADEEYIAVGRYRFSKIAFEWANERILNAMMEGCAWIVIDEIGPLELRGEGFYNTLQHLLDSMDRNYRLLLVVRKSVLEEVISTFHLEDKSYEV